MSPVRLCLHSPLRALSAPRVAAMAALLTAPALRPHAAPAQVVIAEGAAHDFADSCRACHVPQGPRVRDRSSLFLRYLPAYRMYESESLDMVGSQRPSGASLLCLSCHDGTLGGDVAVGDGAVLGTDLRNDHPISIEYDPARDPAFRPASAVEASGLHLEYRGGRPYVECVSCHDPHAGPDRPALLRGSAEGTCGACHLK